jgi:hypothetical protein
MTAEKSQTGVREHEAIHGRSPRPGPLHPLLHQACLYLAFFGGAISTVTE